jgi:restriction endonuclease S subunit
MFPKEGQTVPEIRFKGFKDEWVKIPLRKIVSYTRVINKQLQCNQLLSLSYGTIVKKDIRSTKGLKPASYNTYQIIEPNTIVLRLTDLQNDHKSIRVGLSRYHGIVSPAYVCISVREDVNPNFIYYLLLLYDSVYKQFYKMGDGLRQTLSFEELKELIITFPSKLEEQNYISRFFLYLDSYLFNTELRITGFKQLRKGLLEKMFVDNNRD